MAEHSSLSTSSSSGLRECEACFRRSAGRRAVSLYAEPLPPATVTSRLVGRLVVDYDVRQHVTGSRDMPTGESVYRLSD